MQYDLAVVTTTTTNWRVRKILIDYGSSVDVLYWSTFQKFDIPSTLIELYLVLTLRYGRE